MLRTILVVEDDAITRNVMVQALRMNGHNVLDAPDGVAGLQLFEQYVACIDLLITDILMPGMNGDQLAREAKRLRPSLKILVVSAVANLQQSADVQVLTKPVTPRHLLQQVKAILEHEALV